MSIRGVTVCVMAACLSLSSTLVFAQDLAPPEGILDAAYIPASAVLGHEHPDFEGQKASLDQEGSNNQASIVQRGSSNQASVEQRGRHNQANIAQNGHRNAAAILQQGNGNIASVAQSGNRNSARVVQKGNGNEAHIGQSGHSITNTWQLQKVEQIGAGLTLNIQ
ncbi:MAG: curlin [Pseudomonadota bacterium]